MATWLELTNGLFINLDMVEAAVPPDRDHPSWRFFHPRTQRGGRPYGRPPDRPAAHDDDAGCWKGEPLDEPALLRYLRANQQEPAL